MGNASSVGEGGEEGEIGGDVGQDLMGQSPPQSPRRAAQSPLLFTPQNPMVPLRRPDEMFIPGNTLMQNTRQCDEIMYEEGIPTMITWSYGGKEVSVEGSWDNWNSKYRILTRELLLQNAILLPINFFNFNVLQVTSACRKILQKSGKDFAIMEVLPSGVYQYRFSVDGECRYSPDMPWGRDQFGNAYNILDLQASVPDEIGGLAGFEPPPSPDSSYNNWSLVSEDFAKEPPIVPPQLGSTLLNLPSSNENSTLLRPQHVVLNHLFIQKGKSSEPVVSLSATHRFRAKYVTMVFYKSLH